MKNIIFSLILLLIFSGCDSQQGQSLKISVNPWIGYSPLFYANAMGWLKPYRIKLIETVSLKENMVIYQTGNTDATSATQYEYNLLKKQNINIIPIVLFDRSNGGDMIMSNISLQQLHESNETIDVYLEMDSVNQLLISDFIVLEHLKSKEFHYINLDQVNISQLKQHNMEGPSLIVTYTPYNFMLAKENFTTLLSTAESLQIIIVDALFTTHEVLEKHRSQFEALNGIVTDALQDLEKDPKHYYEKVKPYLENISYEEFQESLSGIEWIHKRRSLELEERLRTIGFPIRTLLK